MMNTKRICVFVSLVFLILAVNCTAVDKAQSGLEKRVLSVTTEAGSVAIEAELAIKPEQRTQGLMWRKELPDGKGMLFVFERDEVLSFWMKNCLIDLSIAFIKYDGTILEIKTMYSGDLNSVHSSRSARYALEAPKGWYERAGIKAGDTIDLSSLP
jgi:uncharacterized membrane protein (UPF0127 family)